MTSWIDLTHPISNEMVVWDEAERPEISLLCDFSETCSVRVSWLSMSSHCGTHVDAPSHFVPGGSMTDSLSLETMIGAAWIADAGGAHVLTATVLQSLDIPAAATRLLVRTTNTSRGLMSRSEFDKSYVGLDLSGARWVLERGIALFGIDYLSVQAFSSPDDVHRELLGRKTVLLEALDLSRVEPGWHDLICLPMAARGLDGAPARVVARRHADTVMPKVPLCRI